MTGTASCTRTVSQHSSKPIGLTGGLPSRGTVVGTAEVAFPAPGKRQQQNEYRRKCRDANIFLPATMRHPITRLFVSHGSTLQGFLSQSREALTAPAWGDGRAPGGSNSLGRNEETHGAQGRRQSYRDTTAPSKVMLCARIPSAIDSVPQ